MIVAQGNQRNSADETRFALRLDRQRARQGKRITLFDAGQQGLALDSSEQHTGKRRERLFAVVGLPRNTLRRKASGLSRHAERVILTGLPPVAGLLLAAPLAADLAPVFTQPTRLDSWASTAVSGRAAQTRVFRPANVACFVLKRRGAPAFIARDAPQSLADHDPQAFASRIGERVIFAKAAHSGQLEQRRTASQRPSSTRDMRRSPPRSKGQRRDGAGAQQLLRAASSRFLRNSLRRPHPTPRARGRPARQGRPVGAPQSHQRRSVPVRQTIGVARVSRSRANSLTMETPL